MEVLRISTVVDPPFPVVVTILPLEVLRISTVVDAENRAYWARPLEVLRISTVVDVIFFSFHVFLWKY